MNASVKLLFEESLKLERIVSVKTTLLKLPVNILTTKEIREIKKMFEDFTTRLDRLIASFQEAKEQKINQNRKVDENERLIEVQFEEIRQKDNALKESIDYLSNEFDKIKEEEAKFLCRNKRFSTKFDENSSDSGSDRSDAGDQEAVIINKIFLNSIVTTNDINNLKKKSTLEEERNFIMELFRVNELFPSSISKQLILVDFYMNIYSFCLTESFTNEQMSTIFSIFYFLFSFSFINSNIVVEKSLALFGEIMNFHSMNRPPFSYEIFNAEEKAKVLNFGKMTFYRNYALFENIYQYEVSICFFSKEPKSIPSKPLPSLSAYALKDDFKKGSEEIPDIIKKMIDEREKEIVSDDEEPQNDNNDKKEEKSQDEINDEKQMEKLKAFLNSFYKTNSQLEQMRKNEEMEKMKVIGEIESNKAKGFLTTKITEIHKEINEKINLCTKTVISPVTEALSEKEKLKKK